MTGSTKLLTIHLKDHDAAAQAGQALARRCWVAWLDWLTAAGRLDELATLPTSSTLPAASDSRRFSHHTPLRSLKPRLVDGLEVMALCGARFTPHRDPEAFPTCPTCEQLYNGLGELQI